MIIQSDVTLTIVGGTINRGVFLGVSLISFESVDWMVLLHLTIGLALGRGR